MAPSLPPPFLIFFIPPPPLLFILIFLNQSANFCLFFRWLKDKTVDTVGCLGSHSGKPWPYSIYPTAALALRQFWRLFIRFCWHQRAPKPVNGGKWPATVRRASSTGGLMEAGEEEMKLLCCTDADKDKDKGMWAVTEPQARMSSHPPHAPSISTDSSTAVGGSREADPAPRLRHLCEPWPGRGWEGGVKMGGRQEAAIEPRQATCRPLDRP